MIAVISQLFSSTETSKLDLEDGKSLSELWNAPGDAQN